MSSPGRGALKETRVVVKKLSVLLNETPGKMLHSSSTHNMSLKDDSIVLHPFTTRKMSPKNKKREKVQITFGLSFFTTHLNGDCQVIPVDE